MTFSDYDTRALDLALYNARENGLAERAGLLLDWRQPIDPQFDHLRLRRHLRKAEPRPHPGAAEKNAGEGGRCWITDPGRHQADAFLELLAGSPFQSRHQTLIREPCPGRPAGTTNLWVLTWR